MQEISDVLTATATLTQLTSLAITGDCWISDCSSVIQDSLLALFTSLPKLQCLVLDTAIPPDALETLGAAASHTNLSSLHTLKILAPRGISEVIIAMMASGEYRPWLSSDEAIAVMQKLQKLPGLKHLECANFKEDCEDVAGFCEVLREFTALTALMLAQCFVNRGEEPRGDGTVVTCHVAGMMHPICHTERVLELPACAACCVDAPTPGRECQWLMRCKLCFPSAVYAPEIDVQPLLGFTVRSLSLADPSRIVHAHVV